MKEHNLDTLCGSSFLWGRKNSLGGKVGGATGATKKSKFAYDVFFDLEFFVSVCYGDDEGTATIRVKGVLAVKPMTLLCTPIRNNARNIWPIILYGGEI